MGADLHCHTKISDGSTGIEELIYIAKKMNIKTISVTDHDTFAGAKRAKILGQRQGIDVIMGAEFSAYDYNRDKNVHILCYMCDNPDRLLGLCKKTGENTQKAAARMLQKAMRFYPISPEIVSKKAQGSTNIFKNHIMQAIMDAGYSTPDYNNMFDKLFDPINGIVYAKTEYPDVSEVIQQIHAAGGVAVLAHPNLYDNVGMIKELKSKGLDGVEVWSPSSDEGQTKEIYEIAKSCDLIMTGGSDFHGMYSKSKCPIGTCTTPMEQIEKIRNRKNEICKNI